MRKTLEVSLRVLLWLGAILFFWAAGGCFIIFGQESSNIPPDVLMVSDMNCRIEPRGKRFVAHGIATYANHSNYHHDEWRTPDFQERKSDAASLKDCDKWFAQVKKIQAVTKPVDVSELLKKNKETKQ